MVFSYRKAYAEPHYAGLIVLKFRAQRLASDKRVALSRREKRNTTEISPAARFHVELVEAREANQQAYDEWSAFCSVAIHAHFYGYLR